MSAPTFDSVPVPPPGALRHQVVRGIVWVLSAQSLIKLIGFGSTIVLVRLLGPRNYGLSAEALVFTQLAFLFSDVGLRVVLVQRKALSEDDRSTAFWMSALIGLAVSIPVIALAHPIAAIFRNQQVAPLLEVLPLYVFFTALGVTPGGLLARELRFRTLEIRAVVASALAAASAIVVAALGYGPWAIVTQLVVEAAVGTALLWLSVDWRPRFVFSRSSLRGLAGVSGYIFGKGFFSYLHRNADNFLVGRFLGAPALGAYTIAYNVMQWPLQALAIPVWDVIFPAMSKIHDPKRIGDVWIRITRFAAMITAPAYLGMIVVAPDFVDVVFGNRWHDATPVLRILCYVGFIQAFTILVGEVLMVLDGASTLFWLSVGGAVVMVTAFALGLRWGIIGVSSTYAAANTPVTVAYAFCASRATGIPMREFLKSVRGIVGAAAAMAVVLFVVRELLIDAQLTALERLVVVVPLGFVVFAPLCARGARDAVVEARELIRSRGRLAPPVPEPAAVTETP